MRLRFSLPGDEPSLKQLWKTVFGDEDAVIDGFFRELYTPGAAFVAEDNGLIAAGAYVIPFGSCRYIYAVAALPAYRGQGLGRAVTLGAADGQAAYLAPAEPSLIPWYTAMGAKAVSFASPLPRPVLLREISAGEYALRREALLRDIPHAEYTPAILRFFSLWGRFYATENGIAAMEGDSVREVLPCPGGDIPCILGLNGAEALYWGLTLA